MVIRKFKFRHNGNLPKSKQRPDSVQKVNNGLFLALTINKLNQIQTNVDKNIIIELVIENTTFIEP